MLSKLRPDYAPRYDVETDDVRIRSLAAAVISQAIADACDTKPSGEAISFLTCPYGAWRTSREEWLSILDIAPSAFAARIGAILSNPTGKAARSLIRHVAETTFEPDYVQ
jgi:hypothetical protein